MQHRGQPLVSHVLDSRPALGDGRELARVDVHAHDRATRLGKSHGERQADIAQPHDPDGHADLSVRAAATRSPARPSP